MFGELIGFYFLVAFCSWIISSPILILLIILNCILNQEKSGLVIAAFWLMLISPFVSFFYEDLFSTQEGFALVALILSYGLIGSGYLFYYSDLGQRFDSWYVLIRDGAGD